MATDVREFLGDLDSGTVESVLGKVLSAVAAATIDHDGKGKVVLALEFKRIAKSSNQVLCGHKISYTHQTTKGDLSENVSGETAMFVAKGGDMFVLQQDLLKKEQGQMFPFKDVPV